MMRPGTCATMIIVANLLVPVAAHAESIRNPLAVFAGLDKVTGKIKSFQIPIERRGASGACSSVRASAIRGR